MNPKAPWLALVVGNTRLHWAAFSAEQLLGTWHTHHLNQTEAASLLKGRFALRSWAQILSSPVPAVLESIHLLESKDKIPLYLASVVPSQSALWQSYTGLQEISLSQIPLADLYPTLGIDRALNLLGAGDRYGWPVLVVDSGTALTFTAGAGGKLVGGAILPGLSLQFKALSEQTASLPPLEISQGLPGRWARNTPDAIQSGILRGAIATATDFIADWHNQHPDAPVILTGGDGPYLFACLRQRHTHPALYQDSSLIFWGVNCFRQQVHAIKE